VREADQLIAGALRDIAAEAGLPRPVADAAWRAGRRRRLTTLAASAASVAAAIALALAVVLPLAAAPGPASPPGPPARLVSITLSPATPARTDVLAGAAEILRQRAAHLHLPSIQAQVLGPNVVLTGPAADEAQLKTLAQGGVLNFRQVLLYQPYSGTAPAAAGASTYGDASLVNHNTFALFSKLVCASANTSTWKDQVGYSVAGDYDNPNTQIVSCDSSGGKYALDLAKVQGTQIGNATAKLSTTSNQQEVMLTLNRAGAAAFGALTSQLFSTYSSAAQAGHEDDLWLDTVASVLDGNVVSAPHIESPIPDGKIPVVGNFTRAQAEELAAQLQSGPLPVDFRISAISTSAPSASSQAAAG
jgi:preprotein translocase subunit SecD